MKSKKFAIIAILAMALVMMIGCNLVANVTSIDFTNAPKAFYKLNDKVAANTLKVKITMNDNTSFEVPLTDSRLTVEGLVDGMLDTATEGTKTLKVTYMGISITVTYVVGQDSVGILWSDERVEGDGKTLLEDIKNNNLTETEYDLAGYQWDAPVIDGAVTLTPANQVVIKNLTMTTANAFEKAGGLIAVAKGNVTISNIKFENVKISNVDNGRYENAKNYGILVGHVNAQNAVTTISNIEIEGATMLGNGRVAGILGQVANNVASTTITNCRINDATITGYNPVKDMYGDGEADKIGGIIGQVQGGNLTITDCTVTNTTINGTRDLGGLVGYLAAGTEKTLSINNNTLTNVGVVASTEGGMTFTKGYRNVGGIIGTIAGDGAVEIKTNNLTDVVAEGNEAYIDVTSDNLYVGGFRRACKDTKVNGVTVSVATDGARTFKINGTDYNLTSACLADETFKTEHTTQITNLNTALAEANN